MVYIYALCDIFYDSYYIKGFKDVFKSYKFNIDKFPEFNQNIFAAILIENGIEKKIIIDSNDGIKYNNIALEWCDVYGKINYNINNIPSQFAEKIVPIGPSFGIKIWNLVQTLFLATCNTLKYYKYIKNKREYIANYWRQYKRMPLKSYNNDFLSKEDFIFFTSSIWKNESITNDYRATYIKSCISNEKIKFEGGFAPRNDGDNLNFDDLLISKRYTIKEYLYKTKQSAMVFNTPAVLFCHGWKLAEFLALGKAIITTEHKNLLPFNLEDNKHVLYVEKENMNEKINLILENKKIRETLEYNSRNYFNKYLAPDVVINRLIK